MAFPFYVTPTTQNVVDRAHFNQAITFFFELLTINFLLSYGDEPITSNQSVRPF